MMKHLLQILLLSILLCSTGCGSYISLRGTSTGHGHPRKVYGGVRDKWRVIESDFTDRFVPFWIADIPFSAAVDTVAIPFTVPYNLLIEQPYGKYCDSRCTMSASNNKRITNAWLEENPRRLRKLHILELNSMAITDAGLENLKELNNLGKLCLIQTKVTDAGLEHLKGMTNLKELFLGWTRVTDAGLEHLKGLTNLEWLSLDGTQITDAGLEHLKGMNNLEKLDLNSMQITDAGLEHLKGLTNLKSLGFFGANNITDAGLEHLKGLTNLKMLSFHNAKVTDEGIEKLRKALPNCRILK